MGTSKSSLGPGSGVPLVPPWVQDPTSPFDGDNPSPEGHDDLTSPNVDPHADTLAPIARFRSARTNFGRFAQTGSRENMRRGLGHYVRKGLGGSGTAARRMENTARTAATLYSALSSLSTGQFTISGRQFDAALLAGRSADEVMDALVEVVRPIDGTQDSEANRHAIRNSMSEMLDRFPDANPLELSEAQRIFIIERYVALDVYDRFVLDIGKTVQDKAPNPSEALSRLKDIKDYIKETVSARFRATQVAGQLVGTQRIVDVVRNVLKETYEIFEEYVQ